jgi:formamidopyrimidine-DNA glycosylase
MEFELFYIRVAFALHGQVTVSDEGTFDDIRKGIHYLESSAYQLAIQTVAHKPAVLIFTDYNKLATYRFIWKSAGCGKWESDRNCDPIDNWEEYEQRILEQLPTLQKSKSTIFDVICSNKLFNGFGSHHTTEALHIACIHPMTPATTVFKEDAARLRLLDALHKFASPPKNWKKYVPKNPTPRDPFRFNQSAWQYFRRINKVYKKEYTFMDIAHYETMVACNKVFVSSGRYLLLDNGNLAKTRSLNL